MRQKKTFQQIENEILDEYLDEDYKEIEKIKRLRKMGIIDDNGDPAVENPDIDI